MHMGVKIREKPVNSGIWWIFINHQGKRRAKKVGRDRKLALDAAKKIEAKLALGDVGLLDNQGSKTPTFREYVHGWQDNEGPHIGWLDKVARLSLKNSTRLGYELILKTHLIPVFGGTRLDQITSRAIGDFIFSKFKQGLRSSTIKNIKNTASAILRHAHTTDGFIAANPARGITVPRPEDEIPARDPDPFTWDEKRHLEQVFQQHFPRYYPLVLCGFRTGMRIGELIALQWQDIDFHNRLILVQRNITRGKVTTPKSRSSKRSVRMTKQLVDVLKGHRHWMKEEVLRHRWGTLPEWAFCNEHGGFLSYPNFIHRVWNRALEKSDLRRRTPHDMRHTYATLRLSKGDSLAEVSKEMGHASTDITYRTYYKWLPKESRSNIDELDDIDANICNLSATKN
jgi:integrase